MAFPWIFEENFELGTKGDFDSETDTDNRLDFAGAADLAADGLDIAPFRGGYVMRVDMGKSSADAYVQDAAFAVALDTARWVRHYLMASDDFALSDGDIVNIFSVYSGSSTFEMGVGIMRSDPDGIVLVAQNAIGGTTGPFIKLDLGVWTCIEMTYTPNASNSQLGLYVNGNKVFQAGIASAAITFARFGAMSQTGDFHGTLYWDQIVLDDERVLPITEGPMDSSNVDGHTMLFTKSGFAFIGSGEILEAQALDNGSSDVRVKVYDTDNSQFIAEFDKRIDRRFDNFLPLQPTNFSRGAFVQLSGTNPQALVRVGTVDEFDFLGDRMSASMGIEE